MKKNTLLIIICLALALLLRVALLASTQGDLERAYEPDTVTYIEPALRLLRGEGFIDDGHRTPIYPFFIALIYKFFGEKDLPVIVAQIILSVSTVYLTFQIGRKLFSESTGLLAAFFLAISIESITLAIFLLTETLFTLLFLGSILAYLFFRESNKQIWIIASGILVGLSVLCRPIAAYFPYFFIVLMLFDQAKANRERLVKSCLYLISFLIVIVPWLLWNKSTIGIPTITTITNFNLLFYNAASLQANKSGIDIEVVRDEFQDLADRTLKVRHLPDTPANRNEVNRELALNVIKSDPLRYIYLHLSLDINNFLPSVTDLTEIMGITVGGKGTLAVLNQDGLIAAINHYFEDKAWLIGVFVPAIIFLVLLYISDLIGTGFLIYERKWFTLAAVLLPILYLMLIPGAPSNQRFRMPAMPFISLLAAHGIIFLWNTGKLFGKKPTVKPMRIESDQRKPTSHNNPI